MATVKIRELFYMKNLTSEISGNHSNMFFNGIIDLTSKIQITLQF